MIFNAGSVLSSLSPAAAVRADCKLYAEGDRRFSVSQVEELGFTNFWKCEDALLEASRNTAWRTASTSPASS